MNLDDLAYIKQVDTHNMLAEILALPDQLESGWSNASKQSAALPKYEGIQQILICGMGGSAITGDLVTAEVAQSCSIPIMVLRDYDLPAWVNEHTLVIASSHSGNTEETLSAARQTLQRNIPLIRISTGGKLTALTSTATSPCLQFEHTGQPRAAVGFSFCFLMAILHSQGWITDPGPEIQGCALALRTQNQVLLSRLRYLSKSSQTPGRADGWTYHHCVWFRFSGENSPKVERSIE